MGTEVAVASTLMSIFLMLIYAVIVFFIVFSPLFIMKRLKDIRAEAQKANKTLLVIAKALKQPTTKRGPTKHGGKG